MVVQGDGNILVIGQRLVLTQDLIRRARRRATLGLLSLAGALLLFVGVFAIWTFVPAEFRLAPAVATFLAGALLGAYFGWTRVRPGVALKPAEAGFLSLSGDERIVLPELELNFALLREERRNHPSLGQVDHQAQYRDDITYYVDDLRMRGRRSRRSHQTTQVITIIGSLAATGVASLSFALEFLQWATPGLNFVVGAAAGLAAIFKFKDRSFYAQQTANAIEQELDAHNLKIGRYKRISDDREALAELLEEIHRLKIEQENREQDLDQAPQKSGEAE